VEQFALVVGKHSIGIMPAKVEHIVVWSLNEGIAGGFNAG
jgi:hypothetical protein